MKIRQDLDALLRREHGRIIALLARNLHGDLALAEDALQAAAVAALEQWDTHPPAQPIGWLIRTARHKAIDTLRRRSTWTHKARLLAAATDDEVWMPDLDDRSIPDERLRLICTCCHPALGLEARIALTLKTLCGLSTTDLARAFMVDPRTMAQRLVRAKQKISVAGIPYEVPGPEGLAARLPAVLHVVYLVFTEGYAASSGSKLVRTDLCDEALRLGQIVAQLLPDEGEVHGLFALMLFQDSRRDVRTDAAGDVVLLRDQDRTRWDARKISVGFEALGAALRRGPPGPYTLQAAIASVHARAPSSDATAWAEIVALYDLLTQAMPTPAVALNRAVAVSIASGPAAGLAALDVLKDTPQLMRSHLYWASRADMLQRLGRPTQAAQAYESAISRADNEAERSFLRQQLGSLSR